MDTKKRSIRIPYWVSVWKGPTNNLVRVGVDDIDDLIVDVRGTEYTKFYVCQFSTGKRVPLKVFSVNLETVFPDEDITLTSDSKFIGYFPTTSTDTLIKLIQTTAGGLAMKPDCAPDYEETYITPEMLADYAMTGLTLSSDAIVFIRNGKIKNIAEYDDL